jgi:putative hydrolase of the HAD superfamily
MHTLRTKAYFAELGEYIDDAQAEWIDTERQCALPKHLRLFEDTIDCLDWLAAAGVRLAAVTNASGAHQRVKLADLGIAGYFETVVVAGEVGCAKPDPVIFHTACARLGVLPDETVHVGDRLACDARGAHDAGLHGVWLDRARGQHSDHNVHVLHTLSELPELLIGDLELTPAAITAGRQAQPTPALAAVLP